MNRKNLLKLADYLEKQVSQEEFDMRFYRTTKNGMISGFKTINDCGAVGCVLGHAPFVEGLHPIKSDFGTDEDFSKQLNFDIYCDRIFDLTNEEEWDFIFAPVWATVDNTPTGAAARIRYLAENGLSEEWGYTQETVNLYTKYKNHEV